MWRLLGGGAESVSRASGPVTPGGSKSRRRVWGAAYEHGVRALRTGHGARGTAREWSLAEAVEVRRRLRPQAVDRRAERQDAPLQLADVRRELRRRLFGHRVHLALDGGERVAEQRRLGAQQG